MRSLRALVLGSGGREHALAWAISRSPLVEATLCAPGSAGIAGDARCVALDPDDADAVSALVRDERIDLVVIGPEGPLAAGLADVLRARGATVFGPSRAAARLESSKAFAKDFMARHGIPTAGFRVFDVADDAERYVDALGGPVVVKADGLAAGKGVVVCDGPDDARAAIGEIMRDRRFGESGARVVIEERLVGEEASFYAISDGERFVCLPPAQDFKRVGEGDAGENTGGMGACSPTPVVTPEVEKRIVREIVEPTLAGMRADGAPYQGVLYVGAIVDSGAPRVIEFNVRFGDPETQPLLYRLESDLVPVLYAAAQGDLGRISADALRFGDPAVCVVLASRGYPRSYPTGLPISGIREAEAAGAKVFHAGTRARDGGFETAGGRVLGVTARGETIADARANAYRAVSQIEFEGMHHRPDIARAAAGE